MLVTSTSYTSIHLTRPGQTRGVPPTNCYHENVSTEPGLNMRVSLSAEPCQTKRPCTKPILDLRGAIRVPRQMEPRGSVTFARDALGLLLARIPRGPPGLVLRHDMSIYGKYAEDTAANKTCLWTVLILFSPTEQTLPPQEPPHKCRRRYTYIWGSGGTDWSGGTAELPALDGRAPPILSVMPWIGCLTQHAPSVRRVWT